MKQSEIEAILKAISSRNIEDVQTLLLLLGLSVLVTYLTVRLTKSAEIAEVNRNFGKVLEQQRELAVATGDIKVALDKDHSRYQIQLTAYQQRSLDAIEELYGRICALRDTAVETSHSREGRAKFEVAVTDFRTHYEMKKIWLPEELSSLFLSFATDLDTRLKRFIRAQDAFDRVESLPTQVIEQASDTQNSFWDFVYEQLNPLVDNLAKAVNAVVAPQVQPNNSSKPTPLRGAA